ncbi:phage terminase small subunit [Burkholderia gladioli pv. alliicola]|uniref:phage terminase small subunit n=1 Tax=Burkholderia gladioli TaxID=28095 RepID=UPI002AB9C3C4|nr:phage terminase small subunit [Burkholderia gladioli]MDZ4036146.1 phage terminase small subunit [Burkholderia gladioli pv. alliicola]
MNINTPARAHFARVTAARAAAAAAPGETMAGVTPYELMLAKLARDRLALKAVQSTAKKVGMKRKLLPEYVDYVAGVLEAGRGAQDAVLGWIMLWRIDVGDYAGALPIARYALMHGLTMPEPFDRSVAAVVAEQYADAALTAFLEKDTFDAEALLAINELTANRDMHDQVRAKLYKALGYALQESDPAAALGHLRAALKLNERVGVKRDIDRLQQQLDAASRESGDNSGT